LAILVKISREFEKALENNRFDAFPIGAGGGKSLRERPRSVPRRRFPDEAHEVYRAAAWAVARRATGTRNGEQET